MANNASMGTRITTTTQDFFAPKLVDAVLDSNVLFSRMARAAKTWRGENMKFPLKKAKNTTGTSFSGLDTFATTETDNRINLTYYPSYQQITVTLPLDEVSVNAVSETKVLDLIATETQSAATDMADDLGTEFWADGTGNSNKDFVGLAIICDSTGTVGGQSRTTYSALASTETASSGVISLAKMATLYNGAGSGTQVPTVAYATETVYNLYEALLQPEERLNKDVSMVKGGLSGGTGYTSLYFRGKPVLADEKATTQTFMFLNEKYLDFYGLEMAEGTPINLKGAKIEGTDYSELGSLGFTAGGWVKSINQAAMVMHYYFAGQLVTDNPKRHAKLTGITSV